MSRRSLFLVPLALAVVVTAGLLATPAQAGGNINALLGQREMDESFSDTEDIQEQDMLGLMMDWGAEGWPINIALDIVAGSKDTNDENFDVNVDGSTLAIDGGVRWYFVKNRSWEPYVGGGVGFAYWSYEEEGDFFDFSDESVFFDRFRESGLTPALHLVAGAEFALGQEWGLLVEGRYRFLRPGLDEDFEAFDEIDLSGFSISGGVSFRF